VIDGNGATFKKANNNQFDFFVRYPVNASVALQMAQTAITFKNFAADGGTGVWQGSGYSFLMLAASNNSIIENIVINNFDIGLRIETCDSLVIKNISTIGVTTNSILLQSGNWFGTTAVGCSNVLITQITINDTLSQDICIKVIGGVSVEISHILLSGTTKFNHGVYYDSGTSGFAGSPGGYGCKVTNITYNTLYTSINNGYAPQGWINALITLKTGGILAESGGTARYMIDTVYVYPFAIVNTSPTSVINIEAYPPGVPGKKPVVELRNIRIYSQYPVVPTLPLPTLFGGTYTMFRNVGDNVWNFQTVDFGGDPTVTPAEIVDPANNLWVTIAPATIPALDELIYINPVQACCGIQEVLIASKAIDNGLLFIGTDAGENNTGASDVIGLGSDAAGANSGIDVVALGKNAALTNTGDDVVAIGNNALSGNTADDAIAIGENAGQNQTGADATLIGQGAGFNNIGIEVVAIGKSAGNANTGDKLHAIGVLAGAGNSGDFVVAMGSGAAQTNTANYVVALGNAAGANNAIPNSTIISNDCLPSYANYAAAAAVIIAPGATTGTYLYHDQATNSIGAVRIP